MTNFAHLTEHITEKYANHKKYSFMTKSIKLTTDGLLQVGTTKYPLSLDGLYQFARGVGAPPKFLATLESDIRAYVFNYLFPEKIIDERIAKEITLCFDNNDQIIGYDIPSLRAIDPPTLMKIVNKSLPSHLLAEEIEIGRFTCTSALLSFSLFTPKISSKLREGDIINGGIDIHHNLTGAFATQIRSYLRRQVCKNGSCVHVCVDSKRIRSRRLSHQGFEQIQMYDQIYRLLREAWHQTDIKLEAVKTLLDHERISPDILRQERSRFSLNNRMIESIIKAIDQDELGPTNTQYDLYNAISRFATHDESLSLRQQRTLMFMAGEYSQHHIRRCKQCGTWLSNDNLTSN